MKTRRLLRLPAMKQAGPALSHLGLWHLGLAIVPAIFAAGTPALAQYAPASQPYAQAPAPAYSPVFTGSGPPQAANQSDEQLLTVARLLEQQGRYAQAQRIYTELERRRRSGLQQFPANAQPMNAQPVNVPMAGPPQAGMPQVGMPQPGLPQQGMPMYESQTVPMSPQMYAPAYAPAPVTMSVPMSVPASVPMQPAAPVQPAPPVSAAPVYQAPAPVAPPALPNAVASQRGSNESFVVDREITPQPKRVTPEEAQGWRNALSPLPAALRSDGTATASSRQQPGQETAQAASRPYAARTAGLANRDGSALPELPIGPEPAIDSMATPGGEPRNAPAPVPRPMRFVPPARAGQRVATLQANETAVPRTLGLRPLDKNLEAFDPQRDASQLSRETNSIRIIPGQRPLLPLTLENNVALDDPRDGQPNSAPPASPVPQAAPSVTPPAPVSPTEQSTPSAAQSSTVQPPAADVAADANPPRFDLAAWIATPEFREMHTAPVLEGLELLARPEPQHRALGAIRITAAGRDARTALPVLRKLLLNEPDKTVRLRIAQSVLQILPNDRPATECLSDLLNERADAQLRQDAASALGGAAQGRNAIAIARLTDALDDSNPRVRAAAAGSLALFGPAAADSISRLEGAAANDVASVQQAALVALASIRGTRNEVPADRAQVPPGDEPVAFRPFGSSRPAPLPAPLSATPSATAQSAMGIPLVSGRVKLTDPMPVTEADASDNSASDSIARGPAVGSPGARGPAALPPKLFPVDRMFGPRSLSPVPEMSDDDLVPAEGTDANGPVKPLTLAPAAASSQQQGQPQSPPQAAPAAAPWPMQSQMQSLLPVQTTLPAQLPASPSAASGTSTSLFQLETEAGASKASSHP